MISAPITRARKMARIVTTAGLPWVIELMISRSSPRRPRRGGVPGPPLVEPEAGVLASGAVLAGGPLASSVMSTPNSAVARRLAGLRPVDSHHRLAGGRTGPRLPRPAPRYHSPWGRHRPSAIQAQSLARSAAGRP